MLTKQEIHQKLEAKESRLDACHRIVTPDMNVPARTQAEWMIHLLQQVYTEHGIAKSPERVVESIATEQCRCWFVLENEMPVAMAALVTQSDGSVELGRAVALSQGLGLGGIAMMRAGLHQVEVGTTPLVAEVRVADEFAGVPSGAATQRILFGQFGLKPHALAPMFNHGEPVRQEAFALATTQQKQKSETSIVPGNRRAQSQLRSALHLGTNLFDNTVEQRASESGQGTVGFELVQRAPFSLVVPSRSGTRLDTVEQAAFEASPFILLPMELSAVNTGAILECLETGWVACGVDRTLGEKAHPVLLLGKLRAGTLFAPTKIADENMNEQSTLALRAIDARLRK